VNDILTLSPKRRARQQCSTGALDQRILDSRHNAHLLHALAHDTTDPMKPVRFTLISVKT